ncbi:hypothetical protein F2P56_000249 [Juglans regia]|uniref:GDSL esterase/lipase At1g71691-like n=1 Tax=Juglans regia TaxID=51240 RepID=A0A833Y6L3_JUGRE|nr:hypothetical protein F2P56_000249 [Juglans regia]
MAKFRLLMLVFFMVLSVSSGQGSGRGREMVPAMFIFGDSLIDNGNNNNLPSFAKANYFPYGIDFKGGPTGRFSNGYTMVDEIAELLGLPLIPAYSEASGEQMLYGVNYASAAAGILDITGRNFVGRIPFNQQIRNFENTLDQITDRVGADEVRLYNLGARKFVVAGLGLMGCIPSILAQSPTGTCSKEVNNLVQPFNANVKTIINNLSANLPGVRFSYIDVARMFEDIAANARTYGFIVLNRGCCGIGRNRGQITCLPFQTPCRNRNQYVFWDAFHPTAKVNIIMARKAFSGDQRFIYPRNIEQLANLDNEAK